MHGERVPGVDRVGQHAAGARQDLVRGDDGGEHVASGGLRLLAGGERDRDDRGAGVREERPVLPLEDLGEVGVRHRGVAHRGAEACLPDHGAGAALAPGPDRLRGLDPGPHDGAAVGRAEDRGELLLRARDRPRREVREAEPVHPLGQQPRHARRARRRQDERADLPLGVVQEVVQGLERRRLALACG